jgi:hypothetical protein
LPNARKYINYFNVSNYKKMTTASQIIKKYDTTGDKKLGAREITAMLKEMKVSPKRRSARRSARRSPMRRSARRSPMRRSARRSPMRKSGRRSARRSPYAGGAGGKRKSK